jgi:subtilisin family serine protease
LSARGDRRPPRAHAFWFFAIVQLAAVAGVVVLPSVILAASRPARPVRYVINVSTQRLSQVSDAIARAGGKVVRRLPQIGVAIAISADPDFVSALSAADDVSIDSIGRVTADTVAVSAGVSDAVTAAPTIADEFFNSGKLWGITRVRANLAWNAGFTGSHRTVVAVIDTGIAWNHPDLQPNVVFATCYASAPCVPYPSWSDHGTHVAGTIAAAFGGGAAVGVGPNLGLASYNVFEELPECGLCAFADSRWAAMIDAARRGFRVINVSLGQTRFFGGRNSSDVAAAVMAERKVARYLSQQDAVVIGSAGNGSLNLNGPAVHLPGDASPVVNVGAVAIRPLPIYPQQGALDVPAFYSNYGAPLTLVAPGGDTGPVEVGIADPLDYMVISTAVQPDPDCALTASCPVFYDWKVGTSMAAAHVAGVAGLVRDADPQASVAQIISLLKRTADRSGRRQLYGHGVADAFAALHHATRGATGAR